MYKYILISLLSLCLVGCYGIPSKAPLKDKPVLQAKESKIKQIAKTFARAIPGIGVTEDGTLVTALTKIVPKAEYADAKGMKIDELATLIYKSFPNANMTFYEESYALPTKKFILGDFAQAYTKLLMGFQLDKWQNKWDCDDFSNEFRSHIVKCNEKTTNKVPGIAVGVFCYKIDNDGYHAIIAAVVENKEIIFIEPQTRKEVKLSDTEKASAYSVTF